MKEDSQGKEATIELALTPKNLLDMCSLPGAVAKPDKSSSSNNNNSSTKGKANKNKAKTDNLSRQQRLDILQDWHSKQPAKLQSFLFGRSDSKSGCFPLHWAAGTGFNEAVSLILDNYSQSYPPTDTAATNNKGEPQYSTHLVNQWAVKPSTGRTPLHYAARNSHVGTCQLLMETYRADPNPKCHRGSVTPLQLAVWQNQLNVVQYLVNYSNSHTTHSFSNANAIPMVLETNAFRCGLNHWIGLVPKHRWLDDTNNHDDNENTIHSTTRSFLDGRGVLPLAHYLHQQGVSYTSIPDNQQNQGHTPLHKAAWGGNIALMEYFRDEHGVYDTVQDACGNYAADLAQMGGNTAAQEWLHGQGSRSRHESCHVLGLPVTANNEEIQARYKQLARRYHPDKQQQQQQQEEEEQGVQHNGDNQRGDDNCPPFEGVEDAFVRIKEAYEHLIHQRGVGSQKNPKYEALQLLTASKAATKQNNIATDSETETKDCNDDVSVSDNENATGDDQDLFHARILAIVSDYGVKGFPVSAISKRWNQLWPDQPFPEDYIIQVSVVIGNNTNNNNTTTTTTNNNNRPEVCTDDTVQNIPTTMIQKRVKLLKYLKWKCAGVLSFRKVAGVDLAFQKNAASTEC